MKTIYSAARLTEVVRNLRVNRRKIAPPTAARVALAVSVAAISMGALSPRTALAQKLFYGNAYSARVNAEALSTVNLGVNLNDTGQLAPFTQQTLNGLSADVSVVGSLGSYLTSLLSADVDTVRTTSVFPAPTQQTSTVVQSTARVAGVDILGGLTYSLLGLDISADVIQSQTTAFFSGLTQGSTVITNLDLGSAFLNQDGGAATLQLDANGQIVANQTFRVRLVGGLVDVGSLTINEQRINANDSRTTEAIHLRLLGDSALGGLANADIIVASSTAGYAPEPGSLALLAGGMLPAGVWLKAKKGRRRQAKA